VQSACERKERTLFADERQAPREGVVEVRQPVRVCRMVELPYRNVLVLVFDDCSTVAVDIKIVWRREHCDDRGKLSCGRLAVHGISDQCMRERSMEDKMKKTVNTLHLGLRAHE
jgi:hypothetical protein